MGIANELAKRPGLYLGTVNGIESGPCVARIEITVLPNGGVLLSYEATTYEEGAKHRETTMLSEGPDGHDQLIVAMSQSPFLVSMRAAPGERFVEVRPFGPYEIEIEIGWRESELTYAYWWGNRGEPVVEQSRACVRPADSHL
jgi:hypothetical protein